jgi:adenosylmethionine-8-amino-7-oxononanoate aminotransferase
VLEAEGTYAHGYTFGGHPVSCAVALANLAIMERVGALANVLDVEPYLESMLNEVAASSPIAVEARGCGFFRSLELADAALVDRVRAATRSRGVIVRTDVRANPCLAISPPLIIDRSQVDELGEALAGGLADVAG